MKPTALSIALSVSLLALGAAAAARGEGPASRLDHETLSGFEVGQRVSIDGVALEEGLFADLRLERFEILAPGAQIVVAGSSGERAVDAPPLALFRGEVSGDASSRVFVGVSPWGVNGFVSHGGRMHFITSGRFDGKPMDSEALRITPAEALPTPDPLPCGTEEDDESLHPAGRFGPPEGGGAIAGDPPCRVAHIAVETDWEFTGALFGGETDLSTAYALTLMAAVGEIYTENLNTRLFVSFLRVWQADVDPYGDGGDPLQEFRSHWIANESNVERTTALMLSGRSDLPYGGAAYVGVLCNTFNGFAFTGALTGAFPYPLQDYNWNNWDLVVVAHELGHNFGSGHTHNGYQPPLDGCGNGDCSDPSGTIMSYCYYCSGGISNIALTFHPVVRQTILGYLDAVCDLTESGVTAIDDQLPGFRDVTLALDVLANDETASCDAVAIGSHDVTSQHGGTIALAEAGGGEPLDRLLYTPPSGYDGLDVFSYSLSGGGSATVQVDVAPLREPDTIGSTIPGVAVDYYVLSSPTSLPDFDALTPYASDVVPDINYPANGGAFATSGRENHVGAVFGGYVTVPADGLYTLYTSSNDGSMLFVGDQAVVLNDGVHGMRERSGIAGLAAGAHAVRVEFFEKTNAAGLIVRIEGPNMAKQVIPASMWSIEGEGACVGDLDSDGDIDFSDLITILAAWGPCLACPEDLNGDGEVGFADLLTILSAWGGCA